MMEYEGSEWLNYKIVCVGDGSVGKTSLLCSYAQNRFPESYVPTVFDNHQIVCSHRNRVVEMNIWDTAGQDEYSKMRKLSYVDTDLFLVCFSLVDPTSWKNVVSRWMCELEEEQWSRKRPIIMLVGCKMDLRESDQNNHTNNTKPLETIGGKRLAQSVDADGYCETSAKTMRGVKEMFGRGIDLLLRRDQKLDDLLFEDEVKRKRKKKKRNWFFNISRCNCKSDDLSNFLM